MKKFLIILSILLLGGAGYFTYEKWVKHSDLTNWSFIPADAALVFEGKVTSDISKLQGFSLWNLVDQNSGFNTLKSGMSLLDSINGEGGFSTIFENTPLLASMHKVSNTSMDFLFVIELENISQNTFANSAISRLRDSGLRFKTRTYNDFKISEISAEDKMLTFIFYKNFFLASFTPYLVEDAVRAISEESLVSFEEQFIELKQPKTDEITLYLNYAKAGEIAGTLINQKLDFPMQAGRYDVTIDSLYVQLSGFSFVEDGWLSIHTNQASTFDIAEVVPENTAYLYHISSSDMSSWKDRQVQYLRNSDLRIKRLQDSLKQAFDFNVDQIFDLIDDELGIASLESPRVRDERKLLIMEVKDAQESLTFFSQLTQRIALARGDSVYSESYSDSEIRFFPIQNFPSTILGELGADFEQCFYINYRNYLIFSNDLQELKNLIAKIEDEDTWGKSIGVNNFLARTNNTANVSYFVNIPRAWNKITAELKPTWQKHFKSNATLYKSVDFAAFQYSNLDGRFYTNYTFTQPSKSAASIPKTDADNGVKFVSKLTSKPYLVKTHAHKRFDIILQDSTNTLYYLDPNQNAVWTKSIEEALCSPIYAIDYYKNGKIQYAFATDSKIHILDRNGNAIPGFPKKSPSESRIEHLNLIDYDLSRNYRFSITDVDGSIYLTDKNIKVLEGWNSKRQSRRSIDALAHARLGGRDVMISLQENGIVNLYSRRGNPMRGFPFDVQKETTSNYFLRPSNSLANSSLTILSKDGELTELTLEGDVIRRDQLIKTSAEATFKLIPDTGGDSFIIVR
ncbi:MAG: hypothetical protein HRT61_08280, partial [Ekhidna sp.]|nr:hypothetical protein [Ekhidna sp.]